MKCNRCRGAAVIEVRRHNAAYCKDCFTHVFHEQVKRAIRQHDMFAEATGSWWRSPAARIRWRSGTSSCELGYDATGLYLGLGIGELLEPLGRGREGVRRGARRRASRGRSRARLRLRHPDGRQEGLALDVRGLRPVEALRLQPRRAGGRVRRGRHRPQPGRRGRDAPRQHARWQTESIARQSPALPGEGRNGEEGEAAAPAVASSRPRRTPSCGESTTSSRSVRSSRATRSSGTRTR